MLGEKVKNNILQEVKHCKYFSISVDSTPDVSHSDQLTFCIRYVKNGGPVERFLQFIPINMHKANYLAATVLTFLHENNLDIMDCRGQSYDNASNMSGKYEGLQKQILNVNEKASYIPCAAHSFNLVGKNVVEKFAIAAVFFDLVENVYLFFVHSTNR